MEDCSLVDVDNTPRLKIRTIGISKVRHAKCQPSHLLERIIIEESTTITNETICIMPQINMEF